MIGKQLNEENMNETGQNQQEVDVFKKKCLAYLHECNFPFPSYDLYSSDKTTLKFSNPNHIIHLPIGSHIQVPFSFIQQGTKCIAQHHAIYIGINDEKEHMVIDIMKTNSPKAQIINLQK